MTILQLKKKHFPTNPNAHWTYGPNIENRDTPPLTAPPPLAPAAPKIQNKNTERQAGLKYKWSLLRNTWHLLYFSGWTNCIYPTDNLYFSHPLTAPSH